MDDRNFDQKNAMEWIKLVESGISPRDADIYPKLNAWVQNNAPIDILDIGSGQGVCSDKIDMNGRRYTGLEPSIHLLKRARQQYQCENRVFHLGDVYSMPFSTHSFDAAFSITVWHLLSDLEKAAIELSRVLKDNGHFFIITANPSAYAVWKGPYTESKIDDRRFEGKKVLDGKVVLHDVFYLHTLEEIVSSLTNAKLQVQGTETFRPAENMAGLHTFIAIQGRKLSLR